MLLEWILGQYPETIHTVFNPKYGRQIPRFQRSETNLDIAKKDINNVKLLAVEANYKYSKSFLFSFF